MDLFFVASPDHRKDQGSNKVCTNKPPADRWDFKKIIEHTMPPIEQPEVTRYDSHNSGQTKYDKPRIFIFKKQQVHAFTVSFKYLHQGQYRTHTS